MKSLANEFFKDMQEGAIKHAAQRGDLVLLPVGMHSETDIDTQVNAVETFITKKVDAIVIAPADSRALVAPLARAIKAGIVVINIDVALDEQAKKQPAFRSHSSVPITVQEPSWPAMNWPRLWVKAAKS